jgi:MtN3 and saliva related transmembrane protein
VGAVAALGSISSFVPQAIKIWREKDASSVSMSMYVVTVACFSLWIVYGLLLGSWPLVASNSASLMVSTFILCLKLRYGLRAQKTS